MRYRAALTTLVLTLALAAGLVASSSPAASGDTTADTTPPETTLEEGPSDLVTGTPLTFYYGSDDYSASFECRLDGGPFEHCGFERETVEVPLADGPHTFEMRARDQTGNVDPTPAADSFTVDGTPPTLELTSAPHLPRPAPSPYADSVRYVGRGKGVKVEFRVKHRRLIWAGVVVRLRCIGPKGRRHPGRESLVFAEPGWGALPLDARGRFHWGVSSEEPGASLEKKLAGTVRHRSIVGQVSFYENLGYRHLRCRTGTRSSEKLRFRARRVSR